MPPPNHDQGERIPGNLSESVFEGLQHERNRQHILGIIKDYTEHADFVEKVRKYAGQEIDGRLFVSTKFWLATIAAALVSGGIGAGLTHLLGK